MSTNVPAPSPYRPPLSARIEAMEESQTIAMAKLGRALKAKGHDVINLSFGEPDFAMPAHLQAAAKRAIDEGWSHYPPVPGYPELRKAIADKFSRENGLAYMPEQIVVSTGAKQSIANLVMCTINPGDEVIVLAPYWVSYLEIIKLAGGVPVIVSGTVEEGYKPGPEALRNALTDRTRLIMYSSPSNPTGAVFHESELAGMAAVIREHPYALVMSDEIYEHINYTGRHASIGAQPGMLERTVTINGLSKGFAMTGWRIGYLGAPLAVAQACDKMQGQFTSGANSIAQRVAIAALTEDLTPTREMCAHFERRRDATYDALRQIPGLKMTRPDGAFYHFPDVSAYLGRRTPEGKTMDTSLDLCLYLLETEFISLVPGEAFGDPQAIRMSFAASDEQLDEACRRLARGLSTLS